MFIRTSPQSSGEFLPRGLKIFDLVSYLTKQAGLLSGGMRSGDMNFMWINTLRVTYHTRDFDITIPDVKDKTPVVLTNVIINLSSGPILFTYEGKYYEGITGEVKDYRQDYAQKIGLPLEEITKSSTPAQQPITPSQESKQEVKPNKENIKDVTPAPETRTPEPISTPAQTPKPSTEKKKKHEITIPQAPEAVEQYPLDKKLTKRLERLKSYASMPFYSELLAQMQNEIAEE